MDGKPRALLENFVSRLRRGLTHDQLKAEVNLLESEVPESRIRFESNSDNTWLCFGEEEIEFFRSEKQALYITLGPQVNRPTGYVQVEAEISAQPRAPW